MTMLRKPTCRRFTRSSSTIAGIEAHQELIALNNRLLKFVEDGGTLLVFYHRTNEWNPNEQRNRPQLAPFPILLDDDRVTEEEAPVAFLQPRHPLLNFPNKITQKDFADWIQERGLYFRESGIRSTPLCCRLTTKASRRYVAACWSRLTDAETTSTRVMFGIDSFARDCRVGTGCLRI